MGIHFHYFIHMKGPPQWMISRRAATRGDVASGQRGRDHIWKPHIRWGCTGYGELTSSMTHSAKVSLLRKSRRRVAPKGLHQIMNSLHWEDAKKTTPPDLLSQLERAPFWGLRRCGRIDLIRGAQNGQKLQAQALWKVSFWWATFQAHDGKGRYNYHHQDHPFPAALRETDKFHPPGIPMREVLFQKSQSPAFNVFHAHAKREETA